MKSVHSFQYPCILLILLINPLFCNSFRRYPKSRSGDGAATQKDPGFPIWSGMIDRRERSWIPDQVGDDSKRKTKQSPHPLLPLRLGFLFGFLRLCAAPLGSLRLHCVTLRANGAAPAPCTITAVLFDFTSRVNGGAECCT